MAQALYDPYDGYYVTGRPIGSGGDFTTAPEISQIFGELVALWLLQSWMDLDCPTPCHLIELGPGRGTLMADILRVGAKVDGFLDAVQVHLVESNKNLRLEQTNNLSHHKPQWYDHISEVPHGPSLIIGNEFLDCMPVRQFVLTQAGWREKQVGVDREGALVFGLGRTLLASPTNAQANDPIASVREAAPQLTSFVEEIAVRLTSHVGRALFLDYCDLSGGPGDTLQALYRHTKTHPLDHVGEADLTAHVDFHALNKYAQLSGLRAHGPITQREFLLGLGIDVRASALIAANPHCANDVLSGVERLIGEAHMGALFGAVCIDSPLNDGRGPPLGPPLGI